MEKKLRRGQAAVISKLSPKGRILNSVIATAWASLFVGVRPNTRKPPPQEQTP